MMPPPEAIILLSMQNVLNDLQVLLNAHVLQQ